MLFTSLNSEHHYSSNERFMVLVCSLCLAFGLSAIFTNEANQSCEREPESCEVNTVFFFPLIVTIVQTFLDSFAKFFNSCGCVQSGVPKCIKDMFECIGKAFFCFLALIALGICVIGIIMVEQKNKKIEGDSWGKVFAVFIATKLISAMVTTSIVLLVKFHYFRSQQVRMTSYA